jgi:hypothetical protein
MRAERCQGETKSGRPCGELARADFDTCAIHSGDEALASAFMAEKGRRGRAAQAEQRAAEGEDDPPPDFSTVESVQAWLEGEARRSRAKNSPQILNAASNAAKVALSQLIPIRQLQQQNKELRAELKKRGVVFNAPAG